MLFQPLNHLCPVGRAALRTAATSWRSFGRIAIFAWTNDNASGTGLRSPCFYAFHQPPVLPWMKAPWELRAQFLEQLRGCDIRGAFEAPAHERPDHIQRVERARAALGVDQLRPFWRLLSGSRGQNQCSLLRDNDGGLLLCLRDSSLDHALQTAQVSRLGFDRESRTDLAAAPCARETGHKGRQIRRLGCWGGWLLSIGECRQMRLNGPYLFQEPQCVIFRRNRAGIFRHIEASETRASRLVQA